MQIYPFDQDDSAKPVHSGPQLSRHESIEIFKEMVRAELRNGPLAARRRKRLIQYAAALQLRPLEASRIITSISIATGQEPERTDLLTIFKSKSDQESASYRIPLWLMIVIPLLAAFAIDRFLRGMF